MKRKIAKFASLSYLCTMILVFTLNAHAEIVPQGGKFDPRVRVVEYNPTNVVKISTFYGVSTHVQFSNDENITDIALGDDQAWNVVPRGNHMFVKPKAKNADTNVTVITNKRVYHFALVVTPRNLKDSTAWRDPELVYGLTFKYPEELTDKLVEKLVAESRAEEKMLEAQAQEAEKKQKAQALKDEIQLRESLLKSSLRKNKKNPAPALDGKKADEKNIKPVSVNYQQDVTEYANNTDYWASGDTDIRPTAASDDSRFTYLTFSHNRDMPAVYSVDAHGNESIINTSVEGNTIVVHRVVAQLRLRKGDFVVCIRNNAFNPDGGSDNDTGTILPNIERVTQEPK